MDNTVQNRSRLYAWLITFGVHALMLLAFFYFKFQTPNPPYPETGGPGLELNFGNLVEGTGDVENDQMGDTQAEQAQSPSSESNEAQPEDNLTSDVDESIAINNPPKDKPKNATSNEVKPTPEPEQTPSSELTNRLNVFKNKKGQSGGGDGNSGQAGNQGDPNGNPYADGNGAGNGLGQGVGAGKYPKGYPDYSLANRKLVKRPELVDDSQEEGKVIVEIIVDKSGKVISANPGVRGTTTNSSILLAKARQAALNTRFNPSPDGTEEQRGTMTFVFIIK